MTKKPMNPTPSPTLENAETDRVVGSNPTDGSAPAISPVYLAESRRSRRGGESRPKDSENERRDALETELRERFGAASVGSKAAGRLKARVRANMREFAAGGGWIRYPDGAELRSDWGELGRGEYLLTQAEAELADVESPEVMQADARALAAARDLDAAREWAREAEDSDAGRLSRRCRVRLDRALAAAEWEARRRALLRAPAGYLVDRQVAPAHAPPARALDRG